ncbi:ABC transporter substrate-binding protein [Conexibacter sp. CPCC 206217]|uniref:ABC transporter substrate-binding protein n=1 Tax=Conexibacter sp. CPCC 206217 TaxID=3064574 RepID=UPI00271ED8D1|nr:ABC transporter substrate-binding protein [Conexibacter sp. CPCC 206217]MDO8208815.1 ABC transporter substrate-binding protein [Conexibacter sp. CPCC 206217]
MPDRRTLTARALVAILALGTTLALAACGSSDDSSGDDSGGSSSASSATTTADAGASSAQTVKIGVFPGLLLGPEVAEAQGMFERNGVRAELVTLTAGPALMAAVAKGSVDVVFGDTLAWAAATSNGFDNIQVLLGGTVTDSRSPSPMHLIAGPDSGVRTVADLSGKTIGVIPTPQMSAAIGVWLQQNGVDPRSVRVVTVQDGNQSSALKTNSLAAVQTRNTAQNLDLTRNYGGVDLQSPLDAEPQGTANANYFANAQWVQDDPELAQRTATALREASVWLNDAPSQEKADLAARYAGIDYARLSARLPGLIRQIQWEPWITGPIDLDATQRWIDVGSTIGLLRRAVEIADHLAPTAQR